MKKIDSHGSQSAPEELALFDQEALDIADYLREEPPHDGAKQGVAALTLGAVGVVYGDIGTSPIYAFREALRPISAGGIQPADVYGILAILIWTLFLIVTVKYVMILLRADNRGEGGILALYTLVRLAFGRRSLPVLLLAMAGAALFAGDAIITPAVSVLGAVEGMGLLLPSLDEWVLPVTLVILVALFAVQAKGTGAISIFFGPITAVWFLVLGGAGIMQIIAAPHILASFNPVYAVMFLQNHAGIAFLVMGAVFLAVTGAEALYADLGHFGRKPIALAWFLLVFPSLVLTYLGQGALVLSDPTAIDNPFFRMVPDAFLGPLVVLATAATVIASQAVITGAFSMARGAIQLGLLPRLRILHTSRLQSGQIYIPAVNIALLFGVLLLVFAFKTSSALASAYGIAVTGTMVITTILALLYAIKSGLLRPWIALVIAAPLLALETVFLAANLTKIHDGGYVPVLMALFLMLVMWSWFRGTQDFLARAKKGQVALETFARAMSRSSVHVIPGTAFFLNPDVESVPTALLHNLKHNRVIHSQTILLTVETLRVPMADEAERVSYEQISEGISRLILRFGFMETPNVSRALGAARRAGLKFDVMNTTFFLGRRRIVVTSPKGLGQVYDRIYALLSRLAADPTEYYHLPRNRVVELGERVAI